MRKIYTPKFKKFRFIVFVLGILFDLIPNTHLVAQSQTLNYTGLQQTFTVPAGVTSITVETWGGGGSGGNRSTSGEGGGAGGGGYSRTVFTVTPGQTFNYYVGKGSIDNNSGEDTWFSSTSILLARGGSSVPNNTINGANGGAVGIGDVTYPGGDGSDGSNGGFFGSPAYGGGGGSSAGTFSQGTDANNTNNGATAPSGGGNGGNGNTSNGNGSNGITPGGGGGGAYRSNGSKTGGNGGNGQIVINYSVCIGSAQTVVTLQTSGVTNYTNSIGVPDGSYAQLYDNGDYLTLDLTGGYLLSSGGNVNVTWEKTNTTNPTVKVQTSVDGATWTTGVSYTVNNLSWNSSSVSLTADARYIRFTTTNAGDLRIDAITYSTQCSPPCTAPTITTSPSNSTICAGSPPTSFTVAATGTSLSYQWQVSTGGAYANISNGGVYSGASGATLTITGATVTMNGYKYQCIVSSGSCSSTSGAATLTVSSPSPPTGTSPQVFCSSSNPTVASLTTTTGTNIQWYASATGGSPLPSTTALVNGTHYYASQTSAGGCESTTRLDVTATIYTPLTSVSYGTNPVTYCAGIMIANNNPSVAGGTVTSYSISPALPTGLLFNTTTGVISGTPSTTGGVAAANYTVTATNFCGSVTVPVNITISSAMPGTLNYSNNSPTYCVGTAISNNSPTITGGGPATSYTVNPALPLGLSLDPATGIISGTPTVTASATYTVTATNSCGSSTKGLVINITSPPTGVTYSTNPAVYCAGGSITPNNPTVTGGAATSYSVSPVLPNGLTIDPATGIISGNPTATGGVAAANYTVKASNTCGSATVPVNITISPATPNITYTPAAGYCINTPMTINPSNSGGPATYTISPSLSSGLSIDPNTGIISGTPTVASTLPYTITATNSCGSGQAGILITINAPPTSVSYATNPAVYCAGVLITNNSPRVVGPAATSYSVSPALPSGLSINSTTGVISGTPSTTAGVAAANYTITASNSCGSASVPVNITISPAAPSVLNYTTTSAIYCLNTPITNNTPSNGGGAPTNYTISPSLPVGLSINSSTGVISGAPTAGSSSTNYTVTAQNNCGSITKTISIVVSTVGSWIGITNTDWFTPSNWGCGTVPTATIDVTIPASAPNMPNINAAGAVCQSITNNGSLTITGTNNLNVYGDWTNNGTFTGNSSTVTFLGGSGNTLAGTSATTFGNLVVNKSATANTLTSTTKAFTTTGALTIAEGNLILAATDNDYTIGTDVSVSANGTLTHNVSWDTYGKRIYVSGNFLVDGVYKYSVPRATVQMIGTGTKYARTGTNPASAFSIFLLQNGNFYANGSIVVKDNFWAMFGAAGSFHTSTYSVTANAAVLINGGTVYVDGAGGSLNVTGGIQVGVTGGLAGAINLNAGTLNTDGVTVGALAGTGTPPPGPANGTFTHSAGIANIGNLLINNNGTYTCSASPTINITGNWTNNGVFTGTGSQVNFNGTAAQTIGGTTATTFNNLNINNAAGVSLTTSATANGALNLTSGLVTTSGTTVLTAVGTLPTFGASSYVNGKLAQVFTSNTSKIYPVGKGGNYRPVTFAYTSRSNTSTVTVEQIEGNIGTPTTPAVGFTQRYWNITQSGGSNLNYKVTLNDPAYNPIGFAKILKQEGTGPINAFDAGTPNYTNVTGFTTFNGGNSGTNSFALGWDCSSSANAGSAIPDFCQGSVSPALGGTISGTATGGVWSTTAGGTFTPSATNLNATWTPPANYYGTATLVLTTTGGLCGNASDSKTINVIQGPTATVTASATSVCAGSTVTFTASAGSGYNYIFYINSTIAQSSSSKNTFSTSSLNSGDVVTVAISNSNNCGITVTAPSVTINPLPVPTLTSDKTSICPGDKVTFTASGGSGSTGYSFTVNGSPVQTSSSNTFSPTNLNNNDTVSVIVTDNNSCTAKYVPAIKITVNPVPTGSLTSNSGSGKICAGDNITFTATPGFDKYEFFVNTVSQGVQTGINNNIFSSSALTNPSVVKVTATNGSGCSADFNAIPVTVNPLPTGSIITTEASGTPNDSLICSGANVTFTATTGFTNYKFYLRGTGSPLYDGTNNVYQTTSLVNGDYVTVVVTNNNNCTSSVPIKSATITVSLSPTGTLTISPSNSICADVPVTFTATAGFSKYNFKINGTTIQNGTGNTFAPTAGSLHDGDVVSVDVSNANSCVTTFNTFTMHVNAMPAGTLAIAETSGTTPNDGKICGGAPVTFTAPTGFTNYNFLLNGSAAPGQNGTNVYTTSALVNNDNVTVSVTNASGCVGVLNTYTMTVNPLPVISSITGTLNVCVNSTTTLSDATGGGTWSSSDPATASIDPSTGVVTGLKAGTVTIVYTTAADGNMCTNAISATLTVNALPALASIMGGAPAVCVGAATPAFTETTGGGTWSTSDNTIATITPAGIVTGVAPGNITVIYTTAANSNGCISTTSVPLTVNAVPVVDAIGGGKTQVCVGAIANFTDATSGGVWSVTNGTGSATIDSDMGILKGVSPGTVTVNYTVTNGSGCTTTVSTAPVTVNGLPVPVLIGANPICPSSTSIYSTDKSMSDYTWTIEGGNKDSAGTANDYGVKITWDAAGPYLVYVNYTDPATGCSGATSTTVIGNTGEVPQILTGANEICLNSTSQYTTQTGNGEHNYTWTANGGTVTDANTSTATVTWNTSGPKSVSINFADMNGCVAAAPTILPVTVHPLPTATIGGTVAVCQNSSAPSVTFTGAAGTAPYTFTYNINGGSPQMVTTTSGNFVTVSVPTGDAGSFVYNLISVTDANGCTQTQPVTATVTVTPTPSATISYDGGPFCTTAGPVNVTFSGTTGGTYSSTSGLTIDPVTGTIAPSSSTGGIYTVSYTVAAAGGCAVYTITASVTISAAPAATISYAGGPFCTTSAPVAVTLNGTGGGKYSSTAGLTIDANTGQITPSTSTGGTYTVTYSIDAAGGCAAISTTTTVTITTAPSATISYTGTPFCTTVGSTAVNLTGTTGGTFSVLPAGLTINPSTGAINPSTSTAGTYTVTYTVAAANGCAAITPTASVVITTAPTAVAGSAVTMCANVASVNVTAGSSATNQSGVTWTSSGTGTFANANSLTDATYTPSVADTTAHVVTLTLTVNGNAGCAAVTSSKTLTINPFPSIAIVPSSATICQGSIQSLTATSNSGSVSVQPPQTFSSTINLSIPKESNGGNYGEVNTAINVSGLPDNAVVTNITVTLNVSSSRDGDLNFNIQAPNGNILNLVRKRGGTGDNFTNTAITWHGGTSFSATGVNPPFTGTFSPDAIPGIGPSPNISTASDFSALSSVLNGSWTLYGEDVSTTTSNSAIKNWSVKIEYYIPVPNPVTWSPVTDLYTDAAATTPYTGQSLTTVYTKPSSSATKVYTATATNASNCTSSAQTTLTVSPTPIVSLSADYCLVPGKVVLTASSLPAADTYLWNTGGTNDTIQVIVADNYSVSAYAAGCPGTGSITVAQNLVTNGDFTAGDNSFISVYAKAKMPWNGSCSYPQSPFPGTGLIDEGLYTVTTDGQLTHCNFWGHDHTTGTGNFMLINGAGNNPQLKVWQQTVTVLPSTTYYFSAWGLSLNNQGPFASLQFNINNVQVGTIDNLQSGVQNNNNGTVASGSPWTQFYGTWTSGPTTTSAVISIVDLQTASGGNDFGLDDINFGTLSPFIHLVSAPGTDGQTLCVNSPITPIVYSVGSTSSGPVLSAPLPAGLTGTFTPGAGLYTITGTPTVVGNYSYTLTTTGSCNPTTATGTISVQQDKITLSSGSASPSVCVNTGVNIGFTLSGTATGVTSDSTKIPAGFTGTLVGNTYTITGQSATAGTYPYTIVTSGGCTSDTARGTITVTAQTITLKSNNDNQTICINSPLDNIQYTVAGTATGATVTGLPAGVTYSVNTGIVFISGTPTAAGTFNYTVTSSGTCAPLSVQGTINVTPAAALALNSAAGTDNQTGCINTAITDITYSVTNATAATVTGLPAGVTGSITGGVFKITGSPTVAGIFNYSVTTTDGCGTATASGTITVTAQTITLSDGSSSPTVCENAALGTPIVFTIGGTASGATTAGLPAGMAGTRVGNTYTIAGTPTESGTFNYTVTVTGTCATNATTTGIITVTEAAVGGTLASVAVCGGASGPLTLLNYSGTIDHWETSTDQVTWTNIVNNTINQAYTNVMTPTYYRVAVTTTCGQVYSTTATIAIHNLWTGATDTNWNTASNWSDGNVPTTACPDVYIPGGAPNQPTLGSGTATIINLHIYAGAVLTVSDATMQIGGAISNAGNFDVSAGTLEFNGSSPQTVSGSMFNNNKVENMIVSNNSLTIVNDPNHVNDTLKISGVVSFGTAAAKLATGNYLTLLSTKDNTASIGTLATGNAVAGQVEVERFINVGTATGTHAKTWQFLATPTQGQSLYQSWMENGIKTSTGYGAQFTGTPTTTGYDGSSPAPSVKFWDESTGAWHELANTGSQLYNPRGYFAFIRGDRSVSSPTAPAVPTTLRSKGTILTGNQSITVPSQIQTPGNAFFSIGNPYPSAVDMTQVKTGANEPLLYIYIWNPSLGGQYGVGAWNTYQFNGTHYAPVPDGPVDDFIQSGQGFQVQEDITDPTTVNFSEQNKVSASLIRNFRYQGITGKEIQLVTNVLAVKEDATTSLTDGTLHQFDKSYSLKVDGQDARKIMNSANNFSIKTGGLNLIVERRTLPTEQDTIQYNMANMQAQNYRLEFKAQGLSAAGVDGFIEDTYSKIRTPLNMEGTTDVNFAITSDKATSAANRFRIVFKTAVVLPLKLVSVTAAQKDANIEVDWKVENEQTVKQYVVEKSIDGVNFKTAYTVAAANNGAGSYLWLDQQVTPGNNYYRIRIEDKSGQITYSSVVIVMIPFGKPSIGIYPNPITDGVIHVQFVNQPKGRYGIRLLNPLGQVIVSKQISHDGGNATENIQWDYNLAHGIYQLEVMKPDGKIEVIKVMY